ncbi:MAG: Cof-type HAD-IIB family hydrolase [Candidatus Lokiarchaeota archaeon]|nr:Cof-type HAD-IIB family hydrolase [Candidatus Harpocratesius repetitus]
MKKKFVLSDLDGTLLDEPNGLSFENLTRLNKLIDSGLQFSIATGRDLKKAKKVLAGVHLKYPVILNNGAFLGNLKTGEFSKITTIPREIFSTIFSWSEMIKLKPIVMISFDQINKKVKMEKGTWGKKGIKYLTQDQIDNLISQDIVSLQFHAQKDDLFPFYQKILQEFPDQIKIVFIEDVGYKKLNINGEWFWLEINGPKAGKGNMMKELAMMFQYKLEDFVVFGDNINDLELMQMAGLSVAVEDAQPEIKEIADVITESSNNMGVVKFIEKNIDEFI